VSHQEKDQEIKRKTTMQMFGVANMSSKPESGDEDDTSKSHGIAY